MQPLIKWPGGKSREFEYIKDIIPPHERYVEPFFGGGAVFFQLHPKKAIINDVCEELVNFYKFIKGQENLRDFTHKGKGKSPKSPFSEGDLGIFVLNYN